MLLHNNVSPSFHRVTSFLSSAPFCPLSPSFPASILNFLHSDFWSFRFLLWGVSNNLRLDHTSRCRLLHLASSLKSRPINLPLTQQWASVAEEEISIIQSTLLFPPPFLPLSPFLYFFSNYVGKKLKKPSKISKQD